MGAMHTPAALRTLRAPLLAAGLAAALAAPAQAQFDPAKVSAEPEQVARHFPDPALQYATPGFAPGRRDFTTHAEMYAFIDALAQRSPRVAVETLGRSQEGRAMPLLVLSGTRGYDPLLPTVLVIAQQHGNEPAGGEAALVLAQLLATERSALLEQANVLVVPRGNPDGAERFARVTRNGTDVNRDHLLLQVPESEALGIALQRYRPQVVLDLHEFTVGGRWVSKFGAQMHYDALLQAATVGNLNPTIATTQARYLDAARRAIEGTGQTVSDYFTTAAGSPDHTVSMGGINADTGRNVGGLRNAVSLLLEVRGVGIGRAHFARRVQAHVSAALAMVETAARDGDALLAATRAADTQTAAQACQGDMAVAVRQTPERRTLRFQDNATGEPRDIEVDWRSSLRLEVLRQRSRPCGYLLAASETRAVRHLRALGVEVQPVATGSTAWKLERYVVEQSDAGQRQDGRGAIEDQQGIRVLRVRTEPAQAVPAAGAFYVTMAQPLAALATAALEPDSQNSFAANHLLEIEGGRLQRVVAVPQQ